MTSHAPVNRKKDEDVAGGDAVVYPKDRPRPGLLATLTVMAMTGCSLPSANGPAADDAAHLQNVRFGTAPGQLLLTLCRGGMPETCSLVLADVTKQDAMEFAAPGGDSIKDASISRDGIMAVIVGRKHDDHGNHVSTIVRFSPDEGTITRLHRDSVQMRFPVESQGGLTFWRRTCMARTDRFCEHDLFRKAVSGGIVPVGTAHRFAEVDEIVPQRTGDVVNAAYPADGVAQGDRYLEYAGATTTWRQTQNRPFGLARLAEDVDVMKAMAVPGGMLLLGQDAKGIGLFGLEDGRPKRLVGLPPETVGMTTVSVRDVTASDDGRRVAMIMGTSDATRQGDVFVLDVATRVWQRVDPAAMTIRRRTVLKPDIGR